MVSEMGIFTVHHTPPTPTPPIFFSFQFYCLSVSFVHLYDETNWGNGGGGGGGGYNNTNLHHQQNAKIKTILNNHGYVQS